MARSTTQFGGVQKIKHLENTDRVLNLIHLEKTLALRTQSIPSESRFFANDALNRAIFIKHNVRAGEHDLFETERPVETKVLVPLDSSRPESGARSFFIAEKTAEDVLRNFFGIKVQAYDDGAARDLKVLKILDSVPSFDPFILREALKSQQIHVDHRYFSARYDDMEGVSESIYSDIRPLVEAALGRAASRDDLIKFVDHVWNVADSGARNLFFEALRIPRSECCDVVFAWKALLYYRLQIRKEDRRLWDLVEAMKAIRLTSAIGAGGGRELPQLKHRVALCLFQLRQQALERAERLSQALVDAVSVHFDAIRFGQVLQELSAHLVRLGTDLTIFQQSVAYYMCQFGGANSAVDRAAYETVLRNLAAVVSARVEPVAANERR